MEKQIIEGNKLIAEFMFVRDEIGLDCSKWSLTHKNYISPEHCFFDSSWDWLMPVVEKIENSDFVVIIKQSECVICNNSGKTPKFIQEVTNSKIEATWLAVVEFIKWYNQNKEL